MSIDSVSGAAETAPDRAPDAISRPSVTAQESLPILIATFDVWCLVFVTPKRIVNDGTLWRLILEASDLETTSAPSPIVADTVAAGFFRLSVSAPCLTFATNLRPPLSLTPRASVRALLAKLSPLGTVTVSDLTEPLGGLRVNDNVG